VPPEVLLELPTGAGVVSDGRHRVLTADVTQLAGAVIDDPVADLVGLADGRLLVGGMLPEPARAVVVLDVLGEEVPGTCAAGVWAAIVEGPPLPPPVRFLDAAGEIVRATAARRGTPVADAITPCPACGALAWTRFKPALRRQGTIACDRCGHAVAEGRWIEFSADEEGGGRGRAEAMLREREETVKALLERPPFPMFAIAGGAGRPVVTGWGESEGMLDSVSVEQDGIGIAVQSDRWPEDPAVAARTALESVVGEADPVWPELSRPALALWTASLRREVAAVAAGARVRATEVAIDGEPHPAALAESGRAWAAVIDRDDVRVTLSSAERDSGAVALRTVAEPASEIDPAHSPG
jgi:hypothetical protein